MSNCPSCGQERAWKYLEREQCRNPECIECVFDQIPAKRPTLRSTHTVVHLPLSSLAYKEIRAALNEAGYQHCFIEDGAIDMTGIAVISKEPESAS